MRSSLAVEECDLAITPVGVDDPADLSDFQALIRKRGIKLAWPEEIL